MTTNTNKENKNKIPGKESLRLGGWEGTRKMHGKLPRTKLRLKTCYASKTQNRAQRLHNVSTCTGTGKHLIYRIPLGRKAPSGTEQPSKC